MIRLATLPDATAIIKIGLLFHKEGKLSESIPVDIDSYSMFVRKVIRAPDSDIVVLDLDGIRGAAVLLTQKCFFNKSYTMGLEQFFWIYPEHRGPHGRALLKGIEDRARELGCFTLNMATLDSLKPEATSNFYKRNGYTALERYFIKRL